MLSSTKFDAPGIAPEVSDLIRARLDALVNAEHDSDALAAELAAVCEEHPDASWEVLALLDQYHRRGHLSAEVFQAVKAETDTLMFGPPAGDATLELRLTSDRSELASQLQASSKEARDNLASADSAALSTPRRDARSEEQQLRIVSPRFLTPGSVLRERYVLEAPLGRGGMSSIFKALDRHRLELPLANRYVAIKVLRDEFSARPEAIVALQDEFCLAQSLSHPNIINVFDLDHDGDLHFITMELLDGELLSQLTERMRPRLLPLRQALAIIREVGAALEYAHKRGVVHADLKPANIMITRTDGVRVLDFGLSIRVPSDPLPANPARRLRLHAATPAYASYERRRGWEPDPRDDIFSLACIAYELFSGERPFGEPPADATQLNKIRPRRIPRLTRRQRRALRQGLAWTRERRPRNVRDWLDGLEVHTAAGPLLPADAMQGRPRRRLWPLIASGMVLITGAISLVVIADIGPFRDLPWAVAAREFTREAFAPTAVPGVVADHSPAVEPPQSAPVQTPAPAATDERAAREEQPASPGNSAAAIHSAEAPATAPPASTATTPVAHGPGVLSLIHDRYTISENATVARVTVQRDAGTDGEVGLRWRTVGASATSGEDFVAFDDGSEHLAAGQQTAVLYVPVMSDAVQEHTEHFYVEIDDPRGGASLGSTTRATVIIEDDD